MCPNIELSETPKSELASTLEFGIENTIVVSEPNF